MLLRRKGVQIFTMYFFCIFAKKYRVLKKLDWYIIRKFLTTFVVAIVLIILIVIVFDVSEKLDDFISSRAPLRLIVFQYYVNFIPYFVNLFSHLFVFVSVIFFTSKSASHTEVIAILASGISFRRLLYPYIAASLLIAGMNFLFSNWIIPEVSRGRIAFEQEYVRNTRTYWQNIHIQSAEDTQVYVSTFDNLRNVGTYFTYEEFTPKNLARKITANRIRYDSIAKRWTLFEYTTQTAEGISETLVTGDSMYLDFHLEPKDFAANSHNIQTMNYQELNAYIKQERERGSTYVTTYLVEKYQRLLNPIAIIILTVMGVSLSSRKSRRGIGAHLGIGIALAFCFIVLLKIATVFSTKGNLPPLMSVLIPLVLFSFITLLLVKNTPK